MACDAGQPPGGPGSASTLELQPLRMVAAQGSSGSEFEASAGSRRYVLLEPDDPEHPTAWEGPLRIEAVGTDSSCEAPLSLVTAIYAAPGADLALVLSYSGSLTYLHFIDARTCQEKWPPIEAFTEGVEVDGRRVSVQPGCECAEAEAACSCSAGRVFELKIDGDPALLEPESLALTKRVLGVAFQGTKQVADPKSPQARLIE